MDGDAGQERVGVKLVKNFDRWVLPLSLILWIWLLQKVVRSRGIDGGRAVTDANVFTVIRILRHQISEGKTEVRKSSIFAKNGTI